MKIMITILLGAGLLMSAFSAAQAETPFKLALLQPVPAQTQMTPWAGHPDNSVLPAEIKCYPGGACCQNFDGKICCTSKNPKPRSCPKW